VRLFVRQEAVAPQEVEIQQKISSLGTCICCTLPSLLLLLLLLPLPSLLMLLLLLLLLLVGATQGSITLGKRGLYPQRVLTWRRCEA
jgi:hypothetical protein